jgi:hypothetical protein
MQLPAIHWFDLWRSAARRASLATAACSILLSACGHIADASGDGMRHQGRIHGSMSSASVSVRSSADQSQLSSQIVAAWLSAEEAFDTAALSSDPYEPDLAVTTLPPQLTWTRSLLEQMRAAGQIAKGPVHYGTPSVTALDANRATVQSCVHDAEIVVSAVSGQPAPGVPGQVDFELFISTMELTGSGWKLSSQRVGVGQCSRL